MGEVVNLNRFRKARDKAEAKRAAETNRAAHGRTKAERHAADKLRQTEAARLDGHRLDDDGPDIA